MSEKEKADEEIVIQRINQLLGLKRGFRAGTRRTAGLRARLNEHGLGTVMEVLAFVWDKWEGWDRRSDYFQPDTLFRPSNFERYEEDMAIEMEKQEVAIEQREIQEAEPKSVSFDAFFKETFSFSTAEWSRQWFIKLTPAKKQIVKAYLQKQYDSGTEPYSALNGIDIHELYHKKEIA